jgi:hypothetical protein
MLKNDQMNLITTYKNKIKDYVILYKNVFLP